MSSIEKYIDKLDKQAAVPVVDRASISDDAAYSAEPIQSLGGQVDQYANKSKTVQVDLDKLARIGALIPTDKTSKIVEEYRAIKRPLIKKAFNSSAIDLPNSNVIMVTSTTPEEGKTFNAICLAMSIVMEMDYTVLLIEADLARPAIIKYMGIEGIDKGLVDYLLEDETNMANLIFRTNIPKLSILAAGQRHAGATELISSDRMKNFIQELAQRYSDRIVIIDSPPLLMSNDAIILSGLAGQVVLIVESGKTGQFAVKEAIEKLDENRITGVILNKHLGGSGNDYGYYNKNEL
ncbi:MAG: AAA family ATPase [Gammaproteobacteria bacterium]|nr:AAA family ATPase [Gammaproteobacteria bacterium]